METLWFGLTVVAGLVCLTGSILFLVAAFRTSVGWGLLILFTGCLPIAHIIFLIKYWDDAKQAFKIYLIGFIMQIAVGVAQGMTAGDDESGPVGAAFLKSMLADQGFNLPTRGGSTPPSPVSVQPPVRRTPVSAPPAQPAAEAAPAKSPLAVEAPSAGMTEPQATDSYVGVKLTEVVNMLGEPRAKLKTGKKVVYQYQDMTLIADDGVTVNRQR